MVVGSWEAEGGLYTFQINWLNNTDERHAGSSTSSAQNCITNSMEGRCRVPFPSTSSCISAPVAVIELKDK